MGQAKRFLRKTSNDLAPSFCVDLERAAKSDFTEDVVVFTKIYLGLEPETLDELQAVVGADLGQA